VRLLRSKVYIFRMSFVIFGFLGVERYIFFK
jgi:hypothetical protein